MARVIQTHFGSFSHRGKLSYGIDLAMKEMALIRAARAGIVVQVVDQFERGNLNAESLARANYVIIKHADDVYTLYAHLKKGSTTHKIGDTIKAHEPLGVVGCSGYCSQEHLHFEAFLKDGMERLSIPVPFINSKGEIRRILKKNESLWSQMKEGTSVCP